MIEFLLLHKDEMIFSKHFKEISQVTGGTEEHTKMAGEAKLTSC